MAESLGHKAASGAVWVTIDRFGRMALQFGVNLILARLLLPSDFGIIGMLAIFMAVSQTLIDSGFGSALIQKKNPTQTDYSTIFYWNLLFAIVLYGILFAISPLVGKFFHLPILTKVLRIVGLNLIISNIFAIQSTALRKKLAFRTLTLTNLSANILSASVGIILAYEGFGVWSLVAMQIVSGCVGGVILEISTRWIPSLEFSMKSLKELFSFGGYIMSANLLQTVCQNMQGLIIGRKFSAGQLGYYSQAYKLDQVTSYSLPQAMVQVMFPVYSSLQDNRQRLIEVVEMNQRVIAFSIFPIITILMLAADNLIMFLYGDKWMPSVPYFQVLCVGGFFVSLQNVNFYAVAAVGKSRVLFLWSFYKWGFLLTALLIGMNFGIYGILWGMVLSNANIYILNSYLTAKYVGLSLRRQLTCLLPIITVIVASAIITLIAGIFIHGFFWFILLFVIAYISISFIFRLIAFTETQVLISKLIHNDR